MYSEKYNDFLTDFGSSRKMVLSTAENNRVSSRMMSVVLIDGLFYFQTDVTFKKYHQLKSNPNAALCIDNIQIEGTVQEIGHPLHNPTFCKQFEKCFKGSFDAYTSLNNERLFALTPIFVQRWIYIDGVPYIETFDLITEQYNLEPYIAK